MLTLLLKSGTNSYYFKRKGFENKQSKAVFHLFELSRFVAPFLFIFHFNRLEQSLTFTFPKLATHLR